MKTALELLGHVGDDDVDCDDPNCMMCRNCEHREACNCLLDELAKRARQEMREAAAVEALKQYAERRPVLEERKAIAERIRALQVTP